jgi:hypothetical protein
MTEDQLGQQRVSSSQVAGRNAEEDRPRAGPKLAQAQALGEEWTN